MLLTASLRPHRGRCRVSIEPGDNPEEELAKAAQKENEEHGKKWGHPAGRS